MKKPRRNGSEIPQEIADLSWDELLDQSVPMSEDFLERVRRLTDGVIVDLDEEFPEDYVAPWDQ